VKDDEEADDEEEDDGEEEHDEEGRCFVVAGAGGGPRRAAAATDPFVLWCIDCHAMKTAFFQVRGASSPFMDDMVGCFVSALTASTGVRVDGLSLRRLSSKGRTAKDRRRSRTPAVASFVQQLSVFLGKYFMVGDARNDRCRFHRRGDQL